ncbi:hypothetical protein J6590_015334 [Homalodisca vitripennis]|nr:hypothetical protein J6590_015334 [Homalodisca vitripennis]
MNLTAPGAFHPSFMPRFRVTPCWRPPHHAGEAVIASLMSILEKSETRTLSFVLFNDGMVVFCEIPKRR